jgi:hypothetical protein
MMTCPLAPVVSYDKAAIVTVTAESSLNQSGHSLSQIAAMLGLSSRALESGDRQEHWEAEMKSLCAQAGNDKNIPFRTDAYYEGRARQEEIYLEETEEELRMILEFDDPPRSRSESTNEQREHAAEELITGDSDDPPLSEEELKKGPDALRTPQFR